MQRGLYLPDLGQFVEARQLILGPVRTVATPPPPSLLEPGQEGAVIKAPAESPITLFFFFESYTWKDVVGLRLLF